MSQQTRPTFITKTVTARQITGNWTYTFAKTLFYPPYGLHWETEPSLRLSSYVCVYPPTSADNVTLLAFSAAVRGCRRYGSTSARRAHSSKPAAVPCSGRWMGQRDGQTDGHRTVTRALPHTMRAVSITRSVNKTIKNLQRRAICCSFKKYTHRVVA